MISEWRRVFFHPPRHVFRRAGQPHPCVARLRNLLSHAATIVEEIRERRCAHDALLCARRLGACAPLGSATPLARSTALRRPLTCLSGLRGRSTNQSESLRQRRLRLMRAAQCGRCRYRCCFARGLDWGWAGLQTMSTFQKQLSLHSKHLWNITRHSDTPPPLSPLAASNERIVGGCLTAQPVGRRVCNGQGPGRRCRLERL